MVLEKTEGLVLRSIPFRETSRILTLYTAERGAVSMLAKGVRGQRPRFGAALDLFALSDLVYYHKDSRELQLLSQATLLHPHIGLASGLERYAHGCAVIELLSGAGLGQEPPGRLYPLTLRTLEVLETAPGPGLPGVLRAFQIKAVSFLGHRPELYRCLECGREMEGEAGFAPSQGGTICASCAHGVAGAFPIPGGVLGLLRTLLTSPLAGLAGSPPDPDLLTRTGRLLDAFCAHHLDRFDGFRSLRLIRAAPAPAR